MTTLRFLGNAQPVAQVSTVQVTAYDAATTYTLTVNNKSISTIAAGSVNATATALASAWNNSTYAEIAEVTASAATDTVTLTSDSLVGAPFTASSSVSGGTGTIGSVTEDTAPTGPHHFDNTANWSTGAVPVDSDDVYLENSSVSILYGLSQSGILLTSLNIAASYTGQIGLPDYASAVYFEYRDRWLAIGATTLNVGSGTGNGSRLIRLNLGTDASTVNVYSTGQSSDSLPALQIRGSNASNVLNITQGSVGLALEAGTTAQFPTIRVGSEDSPATDVVLDCGAGCTLGGTITQAGGNVTVRTAVTTWTKTGQSTSTNLGSATITTITQDGPGVHYWQSSGTITTATFRGLGAVLDRTRDLRAATITNSTFTGGAAVLDPNKVITFTNAISTDKSSLARHNLGDSPYSIQRS